MLYVHTHRAFGIESAGQQRLEAVNGVKGPAQCRLRTSTQKSETGCGVVGQAVNNDMRAPWPSTAPASYRVGAHRFYQESLAKQQSCRARNMVG